ncbi:hypothetical protein BG000_005126, partial [Podila horticola]
MAYNQTNTDRGLGQHLEYRSNYSLEQSSDNDVTAPGSPYLEFLNSSFSSNQDLSLPERIITPSPLLESANLPYSNTSRNSSNLSTTPRERILNTLFKRGSKETLSAVSSSSPRIPNKPTTQRTNAHNSVSALSQGATSEGSAGSLSPSLASSPAAPKSILKSKPQTQANSSAPAIPPKPHQPQPSYPQDTHLQHLLSNTNNNNNNNTNNMNHNQAQPQLQSMPLPQQSHRQQQELYSQPLSTPPVFGSELGRPASPFAMGRSDSPAGGRLGTFSGANTASLSSTHRSSKQLG